MKFSHCTIDLETLDVQPTAVITSIAVVCFDLAGNRAEYAVNVDLQSCFDAGLSIGPDTLQWWFKQSKGAIDAMFENPLDLYSALVGVSHFIKTHRKSSFTCWTHTTFDVPILSHAARVMDIQLPIHYREHRDIRTLTWLNRHNFQKSEKPAGFIAHNALHDARRQADYISKLLISMSKHDIIVTSNEANKELK